MRRSLESARNGSGSGLLQSTLTIIGIYSERAEMLMLIAIIAWVQFPLGSNRTWSWSLLVLLIALNWVVWIPAYLIHSQMPTKRSQRVSLAAALLGVVLLWAWLQCVSFTPAPWHNPIWRVTVSGLHQTAVGAISINPAVTETELMKLISYVVLGGLAMRLGARHKNAHTLFVAVAAVGVAYAIYGITLSALDTSQFTILENMISPYGKAVSGGFVSKNSFATFTGLALLACSALLAEQGHQEVITLRGWRTHVQTLGQFAAGSGAIWIIGFLILFAALVASDSRAGFVATLVGLLAMLVLSAIVSTSRRRLKWTLVGGTSTAFALLILFLVSGQNMQLRFETLIETQGAGELRPLMWGAATRAIRDNPILGTGLGTYGNAYSLYARSFVPFVVDRAHNDYLEFAMGLGIPAASLWILALFILTVECALGAARRRRRRTYSMTAVGASVLVGFHSAFDFSLQMPAVAVIYAILLGVGLGQARSQGSGANPSMKSLE